MTARRWVVLALLCGCAPARLALVVHPPAELTSSFGADFDALHGADVAACLDAARAADPDRIGRVVVNFAIERDGTVTLAAVARNTTGDETLATCLLDVVTAARFEPQSTTRVVSYPFLLEPPGRPTYPPAEFVVGPADGTEKAPEARVLERELAADLIGCLEEMPVAVPWTYVEMHTGLSVNTDGTVVWGSAEVEAPLPEDSLTDCLKRRIKLRQYPASEFVWSATVPATLLDTGAESYGPDCAWPATIPPLPETPAQCEEWHAGEGVIKCHGAAECGERCDAGCWEDCASLILFTEDLESVFRRSCDVSRFGCLSLGEWLFEQRRLEEAEAVLAPLCDEGLWSTPCGLVAHIRAESDRSPEAEIPGCRACTVAPRLCRPLGIALRDTGRILEAETAFDAACGYQDIDACDAYAGVLTDRGLFDEAIAAFLRVRDTETAFLLGREETLDNHAARYALLGGRPEQAEQLVRDHEYDRESRVTLAAALLAQGRTDEALATWRQTLDGHPELASAVDESLDLVASGYPDLATTVEEVRRSLASEAAEVGEYVGGPDDEPVDRDVTPPTAEEAP